MFRAKKNRRKVDVAKKTGELKAAVKTHAPAVLKVIGLFAGAAVLVLGSIHGWRWATTSPTFALEDVVVRGNAHAPEGELIRLGQLELGQNLVALDTFALEATLATHPWVKRAHVRRHFPRRLTVDVIEQEAVAVLAMGELYLVNPDGVPFKRLSPQDGVDLPLVTGLDRDALVERREATLMQLRQAVEAARAYSSAKVSKGFGLSEVAVSDDGVTLVTVDGQRVQLGDGAVGEKLERLAKVRAQLEQRQLQASVVRLDNRRRAGWVTVELLAAAPRGAKAQAK